MALFIATVFSDTLGGFTVAFGVAGAGIAFALMKPSSVVVDLERDPSGYCMRSTSSASLSCQPSASSRYSAGSRRISIVLSELLRA